MKACRNVGSVDRAVRTIIGLACLALAFGALGVTDGSIGGLVAAVVGTVMLVTGALGICPLYIPLRISTCGPDKAR